MPLSFSLMFRSYRASVPALNWCCLLLVLTLAKSVVAQDAATSSLTNSTTATSSSSSNSDPQVVTTSEEARAVSADVRRLHYTFKVDVRGTYDDNINLASQDPISDYYVRIDPTIALGFGDTGPDAANFLSLEYDPDILLFFDHSEFNILQHVIHLAAQSVLSRLTLGVSEDAQFLKGADVNQGTTTGTFVNAVNLDVRGRPDLNTFNTQATAAYQLGGKTSISGGFQWMVSDYSQFLSSQTMSGNLYLNYEYSPKLTFGIGGSGGREFVDEPTPDQTFEQGNVRLAYVLTGKLNANASAGVEIRQFDSGRNDYITPVFELGLNYEPFGGSKFSLTGSRRTTASASLPGQDFTSTQITASGRQRLLQRFFISLTVGYENLTYLSTLADVGSTRDDNYYFLQPAIDVTITRFWTAGCYYLHRQNDSSASTFGFDENQAGIRSTLVF
jgi:hypothetical protein